MLLAASADAAHAPRGPHGVLLAEATDPALHGQWVVEPPTRDLVQEAILAAQEAWKKTPGTDRYDPSALLWRVKRAGTP